MEEIKRKKEKSGNVHKSKERTGKEREKAKASRTRRQGRRIYYLIYLSRAGANLFLSELNRGDEMISQNIILSNVEYGMNTIFFVFLMVTM